MGKRNSPFIVFISESRQEAEVDKGLKTVANPDYQLAFSDK